MREKQEGEKKVKEFPKPIPSETRERIKSLLREGDMDQRRIAEEVGVSEAMVSKIKKEVLEEENLAAQFMMRKFDPERTRKILRSTPGVSPKVADYITETLKEAPSLQTAQGVFQLLVGIAKLNHNAAAITTNRIFGNVMGEQGAMFFGDMGVGQAMPAIYPGPMNPAGQGQGPVTVQYPVGLGGFPTPTGAPSKKALTEEDVKNILSEFLKKQEKDKKKKEEERRFTKLENMVANLINEIKNIKQGPSQTKATSTTRDPIEMLRDIKKLEEEFTGGGDTITKKLDELKNTLISVATSGSSVSPEMEERLKKLEVELAKTQARAEAQKEMSELKIQLERERATARSNLSVEDKVFQDVATTGIELLRETKKDLSDTKKLLKHLAQSLILEPSGTSDEWDRKKDLNEEELKQLEDAIMQAEEKTVQAEEKIRQIEKSINIKDAKDKAKDKAKAKDKHVKKHGKSSKPRKKTRKAQKHQQETR